MLRSLRLRHKTGPFNRRQFTLFQCGIWIYTIVLFAALIAIYSFLKVHFAYKILIYILMMFTLPYPKDLFMTYEKYLEWYKNIRH